MILRAPKDSAGGRQLLVGEETRLAVAHRHPLDTVDGAVVVEEEEPNVTLPGVAVHMDVEAQGVADLGQAAQVGHLAAEQPVDPLALVEQIRAHPGDEHQVGLPAFDHDSGGHPALL